MPDEDHVLEDLEESDTEELKVDSSVYDDPDYCQGELMDMISDMRKEGVYSDLTVVVDGSKFPVHRSLLIAELPHLESFFLEHSVIDFDELGIKIEGMTADFMKDVIRYIYDGEVVLTIENVGALMSFAMFVKHQALETDCERFLIQRLSVMHFRKFIEMAKQCHLGLLQYQCSQFLKENFGSIADHQSILCDLSFVEFRDLLSNSGLHVKQEKDVYEAFLHWVKYDLKNRCQFVLALFQFIRLDLIDGDYVVDVIENEELLLNCSKSRDLILESLTRRLDPRRKMCNILHFSPRCLCHPPGMILVVGGKNCRSGILDSLEVFSSSEEWVLLSEKWDSCRLGCASAVFENELYIIGGHESTPMYDAIALINVFNVQARTWRTVMPPPTRRLNAGAAASGKHIYLCGGRFQNNVLNLVERFCPATETWDALPPMKISREGPGVTWFNEKLYVFGGDVGAIWGTVEIFDPIPQSWTILSPKSHFHSFSSVAVLGEKIYVAGGISPSYSEGMKFIHRTVCAFDPVSGAFEKISPMHEYRVHFPLLACGGLLWAIGGTKNDDCDSSSVEVYDPLKKKWTKMKSMKKMRGGAVGGVFRFL